jgi:hypothetical protein
MNTPFPYLNSPCADPPAPGDGRDVTQDEGDIVTRDDAVNTAGAGGLEEEEHFDEDAEASEWILPNLEQDVAMLATTELARTRGEQRRLDELRHDGSGEPRQTTATPPPMATPNPSTRGNTTTPIARRVNFDVASPIARTSERETTSPSNEDESALIARSTENTSIKTAGDLYEFLDWQANRKGSPPEQAKFKEDAFNFPGLLVFAVMRPKSLHIQLLHSIQVYPNAPGSDPAWKGKTIGFLGDRTRYSPAPQMIELKEKAPWAWETKQICNDVTVMDSFYANPGNSEKLWTPDGTAPRMAVTVPRMLALPPDCVAYCAEAPRTPFELATHVQKVLGSTLLDAAKFTLILDWCCMAAQPEGGTSEAARSSLLAFPVNPIIGSMALHKWASKRLTETLGMTNPSDQGGLTQNNQPSSASIPAGTTPAPAPALDVALIAQVTAAVVAALRTNDNAVVGVQAEGGARSTEEARAYTSFQLAKLKGFCCVYENANIPPIWDYFTTTKDVDAHRAKLLGEMGTWARENDITITRGLYFEKSTMDEIIKLEFNPGAATAYFATAEKGMSILIVRPRKGNETADIRSKEQAMRLTERNYTLSDALGLTRKDPRPPASSYLELLRDVGTFCALTHTLFGDQCDYFINLFDLWTMLNSESVYAKSDQFSPQMVRQITWAVIEDSRQFFFKTMTEEELARGNARFPTSNLMNIIGTDVAKGVEIRLGNFPEKWKQELSGTTRTMHKAGVPPAGGTNHLQEQTGSNIQQSSTMPPSFAPSAVQSTGSERPVTIRQNDIHPAIRSMMEGYIRHFRSVQFRMLCRAAGVSESELPVEEKYVRNGKNLLCYSYVLGKCNGKYCGRAQDGHAPATSLSPTFVEQLCQKLRPGVEARRNTEPAVRLTDYQPNNKRKRTA